MIASNNLSHLELSRKLREFRNSTIKPNEKNEIRHRICPIQHSYEHCFRIIGYREMEEVGG